MTVPFRSGLAIAALLIPVGLHAVAAPIENHRVRGWTLAAENCSQCHVIGNGAQVGGDIGPAFTAVALMPSTTGMALNVFLQSHHQRMPSVRLDRDEMDAIIDYILSLNPARRAGR